MFVPKYYTLVSGTGENRHTLVAFDMALHEAGIADYNLVKVSSILPPKCEYREIVDIEKGSIIFVAYSTVSVPANEIATTAVAVAIPANASDNGVIFECFTSNENAKTKVCDMCSEAMQRRGIAVAEIKSSSATIHGKEGMFAVAISAVIMW